MTARTLAILAVVTIVAAAGAVLVTTGGDHTRVKHAAAPALFSTLTQRVNDVAVISIRKGDAEITLEKRGGAETAEDASGWIVAGNGGYPAKFDQVKASLMSVVDIEDPRPKTDDPSLHARIGVQAPAADNSATLVTLKDADGGTIASFIVGDSTFAGSASATYLRPADSPQAWLVEKRLDFPVEPARWMNTEIIRLDRTRVRSVAVTHPDGHALHASRQDKDEQNFTVADLPEGRELTSPSAAVPTANALSYLSFEDVRPAEGHAIPADAILAEYETFDGLILRVRTWTEPAAKGHESEEPTTWAALEAATAEAATAEQRGQDEDASPAEAAGDSGEAEEVGPPADLATEDDASAADDTKDPALIAAEAEDLNERLAAWQFAIPSYKAGTLRTRLDGLLKPAGD